LRRGLTTLEVAVLSAIVMISAAILGSALLKAPRQPQSPAVVAIYGVTILGPQGTLTASQQCSEIASALYEEGLLSSKEPLEVGNSSSPYAYAILVRVLQPGVVNGIKVSALGSGELYKVVQSKLYLKAGRYLVCAYANKYYFEAKVEFLGASNLCVDCVAR